jgi:hypothetical protein
LNKITKAQARLIALEKEIKKRGVRLAYERLQFAGLRLKSGLCWFRGEYFIFVDRMKTVPERLDLLTGALEELIELEAKGALENPLPAEPEAAPTEETPAEDALPEPSLAAPTEGPAEPEPQA